MNGPVQFAGAPLLGVRFAAAFAVLALLPTVVWDTVLRAGVDLAAASDQEQLEWSMFGFVVACLAVVLFAVWQPAAAPWRPLRAGWALRRYVPFLLPWIVLLVGYLWLAHAAGHAVVPQATLRYFAVAPVDRPGFWLIAFGTVVAAPLAEEIVFRGFLQGALQQLLPRWGAIAVAAAVFGLCHTLPYALPVGLLGAFFGFLFSRAGSLWPSVIAHAAHNLLTVAVTVYWPQSLEVLYPQ